MLEVEDPNEESYENEEDFKSILTQTLSIINKEKYTPNN